MNPDEEFTAKMAAIATEAACNNYDLARGDELLFNSMINEHPTTHVVDDIIDVGRAHMIDLSRKVGSNGLPADFPFAQAPLPPRPSREKRLRNREDRNRKKALLKAQKKRDRR